MNATTDPPTTLNSPDTVSLPPASSPPSPPLSFTAAAAWSLVSVTGFHLAFGFDRLGFLIAVFLFGLFQLSRVGSGRGAFYFGLAVGLLAYGPQLGFFWTIFGPAAVSLWLILALWLGVFLVLTRFCRIRFGPVPAVLLAPILWLGIEYFRSELYYLRFSWLGTGHVLQGLPQFPLLASTLGLYGVGCVLMGMVAALSLLPRRWVLPAAVVLLAGLGWMTNRPSPAVDQPEPNRREVRVAGIQLEFPGEVEVVMALKELVRAHPDTELIVLSEYTFDGLVPDRVLAWCRANRKHLVAGGRRYYDGDRFYNTAFVVGPEGEVVFEQAKSVPIQFFKDGTPAPSQTLWQSPWGKIGVLVCYDLSYSRVVDRLAKLGAEALIVPAMDLADWGEPQHLLNARITPLKAAEHRIPILRVASSGISQLVNRRGLVEASAPFPGERATLTGALKLSQAASLPLDRHAAMPAVVVTALIGVLAVWPARCRVRNGFTTMKEPRSRHGTRPSLKTA